jgi:Gpi18-like mannosyltransferase
MAVGLHSLSNWRIRRLDRGRVIELLLFAGLLLCALLVRYLARPYVTRDYTFWLEPWYRHLEASGGFAGLKDDFSNYNVPYLYLLAGLTYLPIYPLTGIKLISCLFDLLLAFFVYRIVGLRYRVPWVPRLAAIVVLLLPTVFMNSAVWAQCDSVYAAPAVGGLYYLMVRRPWLGCFLLGVALAVKLQAIFLFPVLLAAVVVRQVPWRSLLAIPGAYVALALPAALLGHGLRDLALVYVDQAGVSNALTHNGPNLYQFIRLPAESPIIYSVATYFACGLALLIVLAVFFSGRELTPERYVVGGLLSVLVTVFFLPGMHERYFYLADVLSVAAMFLLPRLWPVPLLMQVGSGLAYVPFMFGTQARDGISVDGRILALAILGAMVLTAREFVRQFGLATVLRQARSADQLPLARNTSPNVRSNTLTSSQSDQFSM